VRLAPLRRWVYLALLGAAGIWLFGRVWPLLWALIWPFAAGALFALVVEGPVQWLTARGVGRAAAGVSCLAAGLAAGGLGTAWATAAAWSELWGLRRHLPALLAGASAALERVGRGAGQAQDSLPPGLQALLAQGAMRAYDALGPLLQHVIAGVQRAVVGLPDTVFAFFVAFATAYFACRDRERLAAALASRLSPAAARRFHSLLSALRHSVWGMLRAQLLLSLATFTVSLFGLWVIGAPYVFLASLAAAVFDFLPVIGPAMLYVPWAAGMALAHLPGAAIALTGVLAAIAVLRWSLTPHLFGSQVGLHPFVALASMYVGVKLAGVTGLLLGPLCAVLLRAAVDPVANAVPNGPGARPGPP